MKIDLKKFDAMSPFEIKNELIEAAKEASEKAKDGYILNAGRGNPNFLNTEVRHAFSYLNMFATDLSEDDYHTTHVGLRPKKDGIYDKFNTFVKKHKGNEGVEFLKRAFDFAIERFNFDKDEFVFTMSDAALGDFYPMPSRIFPKMEKILRVYLNGVLGLGEEPKSEDFDLFATEGGAAAMCYLFKSLKVNKIVNSKEKIAIFTPIFSPYLEMPHLKDFDLVEIFIEAKEDLNWQIPDEELEKLKDPSIKAIYLVNPANPTSIALNDHVIKVLGDFIKNIRPDLFVLTDTVYATFVEDFHSVVKELPHHTVCVYSFSKYFGVTGWRLGLIMMNKNNIIDDKLKALSEGDKKELRERYQTVSPDPDNIPFIERLELDSRDEALAHTGGLSCPQQSIMTLFALYELMDEKKEYKKKIHETLKLRITDFYNNLGVPVPEEKGNTYYYSLMDFERIAEHKYGKDFSIYLVQKVNPLEFLFRLAEEKYTILLPGKGFAGPDWSFRISLANLSDESYKLIGKNISEVLESFYNEYKNQK